MRLDLICVICAVLALCFCCPVSAAELPSFNIPAYHYDVTQDTRFDFIDTSNETLDLIGMLKSTISPYQEVLGDYFLLIVYCAWMLLVWMRSNSVTLLAVSCGVTIWLWGSWLPESSLLGIALVLLIGIVSVIYKLFKK